MKKLLFMLLAILVIGAAGCNKNEDNTNSTGGTMSLTVDGTNWTASLAVQAVNTNGVINVTGSDSNAHQASLVVYGATSTGTYAVGPSSGNPGNMLRWTAGTEQDQTYQANNVIGSGTVTITELSGTKVAGTFEFVGYNINQASQTITNGAFSANF